ncbi:MULTISPECIES: hypothetical protein [Roseicyclus]|uniref:hypothetical protein n=1 Tax=Roseicyclus amphidinii TaxID=3034232 RepID=UPI0024E0BFA9|nr:hypothetical protein [Roseicyclus sp. Amp-Y-6]
MKRAILALGLLSLSACSGGFGGGGGLFGNGLFGGGLFGGRDAPDPVVIETPPVGGPTDVDAAATAALVPAAPAAPTGEGQFVGFSVTSLGDATQPGLWLETPLVTEEGPGRVVAEDGRTIVVTLRPSGGEQGSGSRLSLAGYQALGLTLTALPTLTVISDA